ncbi:MAG: hypothetical protein N2652_01805 [Kiritimatiellae bacterium]|nr:hypothetical protein [Kiritimatiellia bacterium]
MNRADTSWEEKWAAGPRTTSRVSPSPDAADLVCERCGGSGAVEIGGCRFCLACYSACSSCCLEFGGDDLWALRSDL